LIVHLYNFFWRARFGSPDPDINHNDNLYKVVVTSFHQLWYVLLYVAAQASLGYHLWHGFRSGFQTLGLNHRKYMPLIKNFGYAFAVLVSAGFASMPLYFYLFTNEQGALKDGVAVTLHHLTLAFN
jgi:succinate dehydrogenase / fumarate reductase cytochrome b subunit